jgi:hypothetical protein
MTKLTCEICDGPVNVQPYTFTYGKTVSQHVTNQGTHKTTTTNYIAHGEKTVPVCEECTRRERGRAVRGNLILAGVGGVLLWGYFWLGSYEPVSSFIVNRGLNESDWGVLIHIVLVLLFFAGLAGGLVQTWQAMTADRTRFGVAVALRQHRAELEERGMDMFVHKHG